MQGTGIVLTAIVVTVIAAVWMESTAGRPLIEVPLAPSISPGQAAAVQAVISPRESWFDGEGTIIIDSAPSQNEVAYIAYEETSARGSGRIATKRLVFPATYACHAGDIPCSFDPGGLPVREGDHVHVTGERVADTIRVETLIVR